MRDAPFTDRVKAFSSAEYTHHEPSGFGSSEAEEDHAQHYSYLTINEARAQRGLKPLQSLGDNDPIMMAGLEPEHPDPKGHLGERYVHSPESRAALEAYRLEQEETEIIMGELA